jgi:rod shape-determining protein MreD
MVFKKNLVIIKLLNNIPIIVLYFSVLNEIDFNYLESRYFSFNFPFILIFYWSLVRPSILGYGHIFIAGLISDVVVGFPIGISSFSYLLICGFAKYLKNITLRPSLVKDWFFFLFTILVINSLIYIMLVLIFSFELNLIERFINLIFTFLLYIIFAYIFKIYQRFFLGINND